MLTTIGIQPAEVSRILNLAKEIIAEDGKNVNDKSLNFSLSADSDGKQLTEVSTNVNDCPQQTKKYHSVAFSSFSAN